MPSTVYHTVYMWIKRTGPDLPFSFFGFVKLIFIPVFRWQTNGVRRIIGRVTRKLRRCAMSVTASVEEPNNWREAPCLGTAIA